MITLISPAKTLDFQGVRLSEYTLPLFVPKSGEIIEKLREMSVNDIFH